MQQAPFPNLEQALVPQTHFLAQQAAVHLLQGRQHLALPKAAHFLVLQTHLTAQQGSLQTVHGLGTLQHPEAEHLQALVPQTHFLAQHLPVHLHFLDFLAQQADLAPALHALVPHTHLVLQQGSLQAVHALLAMTFLVQHDAALVVFLAIVFAILN